MYWGVGSSRNFPLPIGIGVLWAPHLPLRAIRLEDPLNLGSMLYSLGFHYCCLLLGFIFWYLSAHSRSSLLDYPSLFFPLLNYLGCSLTFILAWVPLALLSPPQLLELLTHVMSLEHQQTGVRWWHLRREWWRLPGRFQALKEKMPSLVHVQIFQRPVKLFYIAVGVAESGFNHLQGSVQHWWFVIIHDCHLKHGIWHCLVALDTARSPSLKFSPFLVNLCGKTTLSSNNLI